MKAKLIKKDGHYFLEVEPYTLSTLQKHTIIANTFDKPKGDILQLSLKNCEAIANGYDLDELADDFIRCPEDMRTLSEDREINSFKKGFQKALEILGDKKFSEENMFRMFTYGHALTNAIKLKAIEDKPFGDIFNDFIQSLQQTEWEVEIIMESVGRVKLGIGSKTEQMIPKLDTDGCLILKKI